MPKRQGNNPNRRIEPVGAVAPAELQRLADEAVYQGSGHHKTNPADYGLERVSPRPQKSLCDTLRTIRYDEAKELLAAGIRAGLVSRVDASDWPKYVWSVDTGDVPYEAKTDPQDAGRYHGYPLPVEDLMRETVLREWKRRCQQS